MFQKLFLLINFFYICILYQKPQKEKYYVGAELSYRNDDWEQVALLDDDKFCPVHIDRVFFMPFFSKWQPIFIQFIKKKVFEISVIT